jgi:hypothetical protein
LRGRVREGVLADAVNEMQGKRATVDAMARSTSN